VSPHSLAVYRKAGRSTPVNDTGVLMKVNPS
jgi:hypothetical protein